jgi:hypothetical protein
MFTIERLGISLFFYKIIGWIRIILRTTKFDEVRVILAQ